MPAGRPPKYNNCMDFDARCELYFEECEESQKPFTVAGLVLALDLSHQGFKEYREKPEFSEVHARAKLRIEDGWSQLLFSKGASSGAQFALKNHYGWVDKTHTDLTSSDGSMSPTRS